LGHANEDVGIDHAGAGAAIQSIDLMRHFVGDIVRVVVRKHGAGNCQGVSGRSKAKMVAVGFLNLQRFIRWLVYRR
jgi:hypothetical protein